MSRAAVAMFILNHKRVRLMEIEQRTGMKVCFSPDDSLLPGQTRIDKLRAFTPQDLPPPISQTQARMDASEVHSAYVPHADSGDVEDQDEEPDDLESEAMTRKRLPAEAASSRMPAAENAGPEDTSEEGQRRRRKRRRRRGGRREDGVVNGAAPMPADAEQPLLEDVEFPGRHARQPRRWRGTAGVRTPLRSARLTRPMGLWPRRAPATPCWLSPGMTRPVKPPASRLGPRTRSRRGGRRRHASDRAATRRLRRHRVTPAPRPADPFGNVADIFDMLEMAAENVTASAPQPQTEAALVQTLPACGG